jgi:hypothetical protein
MANGEEGDEGIENGFEQEHICQYYENFGQRKCNVYPASASSAHTRLGTWGETGDHQLKTHGKSPIDRRFPPSERGNSFPTAMLKLAARRSGTGLLGLG